MKVRMDLPISDLMMRFPSGFAVSPDGNVYETKGAYKEREEVPHMAAAAGYIVCFNPKVLPGDGYFDEGDDETTTGKT